MIKFLSKFRGNTENKGDKIPNKDSEAVRCCNFIKNNTEKIFITDEMLDDLIGYRACIQAIDYYQNQKRKDITVIKEFKNLYYNYRKRLEDEEFFKKRELKPVLDATDGLYEELKEALGDVPNKTLYMIGIFAKLGKFAPCLRESNTEEIKCILMSKDSPFSNKYDGSYKWDGIKEWNNSIERKKVNGAIWENSDEVYISNNTKIKFLIWYDEQLRKKQFPYKIMYASKEGFHVDTQGFWIGRAIKYMEHESRSDEIKDIICYWEPVMYMAQNWWG